MRVQRLVWRVLTLAFLAIVAGVLGSPSNAIQHGIRLLARAPDQDPSPRTLAPPPCPDPYEPNDDFDTAWQLWPGKVLSYICDESDQDYFSFWANAGQLINVDLIDMPANYDLCLYDPDRLGLECSKNGGTSDEFIERTADESGRHYAQVYGVEGAYDDTSTYGFKFAVTPCTAVTGVNIEGPTTGIISTTQTFTATVDPPAVTLPIGHTWQATAQSDIVQTGSFTQTVVSYTWDFTGTQTVAVEAVNCGDAVTATQTITVEEVPPAPDLTITDVWAGGIRPSYQVHNVGDAAAPAGHSSFLLVDGVFQDVNFVDVELPPGERLSRVFTGDWAWNCTGATDQITVCVDMADSVTESDEANNCREETWKCDDTFPQITSGPSVAVLSDTATITWQTDEDTDSAVRFDTQAAIYGLVEQDASLGMDHSIELAQLPPATVYHYVVESKDEADNTVSSREGFFETPPAQDSEPPTIENVLITAAPAVKGQTERYTIGVVVSDNIGVERVAFYMDGRLLGTDYTGVLGDYYEGYVVPANYLEMPRSEFFDWHEIFIEATDEAGSSSSHTSPWEPDFEPAEVDLRIDMPYRDHTIYIDDSVTPPGTTMRMVVYAAESQYRCTYWNWGQHLPGMPPVSCRDMDVAVSRVEFYVDGELVHTVTPPTTRDKWHIYDWDASGLGPGTHNIEVRAVASDDTVFSEERTLTLEYGQPSLEVTRGVSRIDNYFRVRLTVENEGTGTAEIRRVRDQVSGFQPIGASTTFYTVMPMYRTAPRDSRVDIDLFGTTPDSYDLPPGESVSLEYYAVPVLHPDLNTFEYSIGSESVAVTDPSHQSLGRFARPCVSTLDGELLVQSVTSATLMSDYLMVTHPWRLYAHYLDSEVDTLLSTMAHLARLKGGVLGYLHHMGDLQGNNDNTTALAGLTEPGRAWAAQMHPDFSTATAGYMVLVGEGEIVNNWRSSGWDIQWAGGGRTHEVDYTDHPYADTGGSGAPELVVGRIIGDSAARLITPLQVSIGVHEGTAGYGFARANALLVSGTGGSEGEFIRNVNTLEDMLDPSFGFVHKIHWKDFWDIDSLPRSYEQHDGLASGDVVGDIKDEIIVADADEDRIYILDEDGNTVGEFARDFEAGDGLAVGDVLGDYRDDIIIGDSSADEICSYSSVGVELGCFYRNFEPFDGLAAGEVYFDPWHTHREEIVMADQAGEVYLLNGDGDVLDSFRRDFEAHDGLAMGDVDWAPGPDDNDEIVVANRSSGEIYVRSYDGGSSNWSITFSRDFTRGNGLTVAEVSGDDQAEIVVGDRNDGHLYFYAWSDAEHTWTEWKTYRGNFEGFDGLAAGDVLGDDKEEILIGDRDDQIRITDPHRKDRMFSDFSGMTSGMNVVYFSGHGNVDIWAPGLETGRFPLDFGSNNPFVFAASCLTGDYQSDDDYNIAEAFLHSGGAVYVGSTQVSAISKNCDAGEWFFRNWDYYESIGDTFTDLERGKWSHGSDWQFWVYEYNLYGDPKYGAVPPLGAGAAPALVAMQPPTTSLQVEIPMFEVITTVAGLDYVEIPGGELLLEEGQYRLPYWSVSVDYPQGYEVQDVVLTDRSGLSTTTGLNLPVVTMERAPSAVQSESTQALSSLGGGGGWVPEEEYRWEMVENADGSSTLVVAMYPFYYWPETTDVRFYQDYSFDIDVVSSTVEITFLTTDEDAYPQGDEVPVDLWLSNGGAAQDVVVNAAVKEAISGEVVGGLPLDSLKSLTGTVSFSSQWDSTGYEPGAYYVQAEVRDTAGTVLDRKMVEFRLGIYAGEITGFTVGPTHFEIGDMIDTSLVFSNTGTVAITATAVIQVQNETAEIVEEFEHDVTNLAPGSDVTLDDVWDTSGAEEGNYTILGYVTYDGQVAGPMLVAVSTYQRVYLPVIMR